MECSVCLDEIEKCYSQENTHLLEENQSIKYKNAVTLSCGHVFHTDCINNWLKTNHNCPYCRKFFINIFPCYIWQGNRRRVKAYIHIDEDNHKEIKIKVPKLFHSETTYKFNRFNIVSVQMHPKGKIIVTVYKRLFDEKEVFKIKLFKRKFNDHIFTSFDRVVKRHYLSKSKITQSDISLEEFQNNNIEPDDQSESENDVQILSSNTSLTSLSSLYSLRMVES